MSMLTPQARRALFWALLVAFVAWDLTRSAPLDVWREPPWITAGSGQAPTGGHCSSPR